MKKYRFEYFASAGNVNFEFTKFLEARLRSGVNVLNQRLKIFL